MQTENLKFDSHSIIKRLVKKGLKESLAEELVEIISAKSQRDFDNLVTKSDLKSEIMQVRNEIKDVKSEIKDAKVEMLKWFIGTNIALVSVIVACFKIFLG